MVRKKSYRIGQQAKPRTWRRLYYVLPVIVLALVIVNRSSRTNTTAPKTASQQITEETEKVVDPPYNLNAVNFPSEGQSAIGTLDFGVIRKSNDTEQLTPMASITKMITVLAILEKAPMEIGQPGNTITLTAKDEQYYHDYVALEGTITPVTAGLSMTQYEALQAILLPSSNNIADTLVDRYFASREEYLDYANKMIERFGLRYTHVADASGFSAGSVSTPSELIVIGQKALNNPVIAEIVAQPIATIAVAGEIRNYNPLILEPGVTGIKPGLTDEAGYCLLYSVNIADKSGKNVVVIGAVMGLRANLTYLTEIKTMLADARNEISTQTSKP